MNRSAAVAGGGDVAAAMTAVPLAASSCTGPQRRFAAVDLALPIGHHQTCSQPSTVRSMLEQLDVRACQHVLDLGAGASGWTHRAAGLAGRRLRDGRGGRARARAGAVGCRERRRRRRARVERAAPGRAGWPREAPYDRILVSAEAGAVPSELEHQLAPGGVMVLPVAGRLPRLLVRRAG